MLNMETPLSYRLVSRMANVKPIEGQNICPNTNAQRLIVGWAALYLVQIEDGRFIAIDGGTDRKARTVSRYLATRNKDLGDIAAVYFTHAHHDHIGLGAALEGSSATKYISAEDSRVLSGDQHSEGLIPRVGDCFRSLARLAGVNPVIIEPDEKHNYGDISIQALATKGHTSGSMSFALTTPSGSAIFVGDALDNGREGIELPPSLMSANLSNARRSVNVIRDYAIDHPDSIIYPAHSAGVNSAEFLSRLIK